MSLKDVAGGTDPRLNQDTDEDARGERLGAMTQPGAPKKFKTKGGNKKGRCQKGAFWNDWQSGRPGGQKCQMDGDNAQQISSAQGGRGRPKHSQKKVQESKKAITKKGPLGGDGPQERPQGGLCRSDAEESAMGWGKGRSTPEKKDATMLPTVRKKT